MRTSAAKFVGSLMRFASVFASLFIGMAFVAVTGASAAPPDKKFEVKDMEKTEQFVKKDVEDNVDSRFFNRRFDFDNNPRFNRGFVDNDKLFFNRGLFFDRFIFFGEDDDD